MAKNTINFFTAIKSEGKAKTRNIYPILIGLLALVIILDLAAFLVVRSQGSKLNAEIDELTTFLNSGAVAAALKQEAELDSKIASARSDVAKYTLLDAFLKTGPGFNTGMYMSVDSVRPLIVNLSSFAYADNKLSITCTTTDNNPPADYSKALDDTGLYTSVSYYGFVVNDKDGVVQFPISCTLK